jgi:hypothetical protein
MSFQNIFRTRKISKISIPTLSHPKTWIHRTDGYIGLPYVVCRTALCSLPYVVTLTSWTRILTKANTRAGARVFAYFVDRADKPNSVGGDHLSRPMITQRLERHSPILPTGGGCRIERPEAFARDKPLTSFGTLNLCNCLRQAKLAHGLACG